MSKNSEVKKQQASPAQAAKLKKKHLLQWFSFAAILIAAAACIAVFAIYPAYFAPTEQLDSKLDILREAVFEANPEAPATYYTPGARQIVFLSLSNGEERAVVVKGVGADLETAWKRAAGAARRFVRNYRPTLDTSSVTTAISDEDKVFTAVWVKADVVNYMEKASDEALSAMLRLYEPNYFRSGIAFDDSFKSALLEAEISGNKIINYDEDAVSLAATNLYFEASGKKQLESLPNSYILFTTSGWFLDEGNAVYTMNAYSGEGYDYGRRDDGEMTKALSAEYALEAADWLAAQVKSDGTFKYGNYPTSGTEFETYNTTRHITAVEALMNAYKTMDDTDARRSLKKTIDSAVTYLVRKGTEYAKSNISYVIDEANSEIRIGTNGLCISLLTQYMELFNTNKYTAICENLGNALLSQQLEEGNFYHVLKYPKFIEKAEFRSVDQDSQAVYGLCALYKLTGDEAWLTAARKCVDYMLENNYTENADPWLSIALNSFTELVGEEKYYTFALANIIDNLDTIYNSDIYSSVNMQMLIAGYETYLRFSQSGVSSDLGKVFNVQYLAETIVNYADRLRDSRFWPENAMYLANPKQIVGSVGVRDDKFRVRIDDVGYYVTAYTLYADYCDDVLALLDVR